MSTAAAGHQAIGHTLQAVKSCLSELADPSQEVVIMQSPDDDFLYLFLFLTRGDKKEVMIRVDARAVNREYLVRLVADTYRAIQQIREDGRKKVLADIRTPIASAVKQATVSVEVH